jgi:excinuclease UvrABC nuclease subunit
MSWNKILWENKIKFPVVSCVYAFYINNNLVYIGSTSNLRIRMSGYRFKEVDGKIITPWRKRIEIGSKIELKYKCSKKYGYWLMLEARMIRRLQPLYNIHLKKGTYHEVV